MRLLPPEGLVNPIHAGRRVDPAIGIDVEGAEAEALIADGWQPPAVAELPPMEARAELGERPAPELVPHDFRAAMPEVDTTFGSDLPPKVR